MAIYILNHLQIQHTIETVLTRCVIKLSLGRCNTHIHPLQVGKLWQPQVWTPPNSSLLNKWVLVVLIIGIWTRCYLHECKWFKDSSITWAYMSTGTSFHSWKTRAQWTACVKVNSWRTSFLGFSVRLVVLISGVFESFLPWDSSL